VDPELRFSRYLTPARRHRICAGPDHLPQGSGRRFRLNRANIWRPERQGIEEVFPQSAAQIAMLHLAVAGHITGCRNRCDAIHNAELKNPISRYLMLRPDRPEMEPPARITDGLTPQAASKRWREYRRGPSFGTRLNPSQIEA